MSEPEPAKIIYIANMRFPTEKAHGVQIARMCSAFSELGLDVDLVFPDRYNPSLAGISPREYYSLSHDFQLSPKWCIDLSGTFLVKIPIIRHLCFLLILGTFVFSSYFHAARKFSKNTIIYTRDPNLAMAFYFLSFGKMAKATILELHSLPTSKFKLGILRWLSKRVSGFVPVTGQMKHILVKNRIDANLVHVEHDAVNLDSYEKIAPKRSTSDGKTVIGYVGRFQTMGKEKGIPEVIRSIGAVVEKNPNVLFRFIGGPLECVAKYLELGKSLGLDMEKYTEFLDKVPAAEVPRELEKCNILLNPLPNTVYCSLFMSPMKLFEYMASSRPIVASNLPSTAEILTHEKNALLFEAHNVGELAAKINSLITDKELAERISTQARKDVEHYTWQKRAKRIVEFHESRAASG